MKIKGAIFDMDGTLLNSMDYWGKVATEFLTKNGYDATSDDNRRFLEQGMREFYAYATTTLGLTKSYDEVHDEIYNLIRDKYETVVKPKDGAIEMLDTLLENGVKMCLATATDKETVEIVLKRLNMEKYFSKIFTVKEVGIGKSQPKIYQLALEYLGTSLDSTYVFEDAYYAINTAHSNGFLVVGVYDKNVFVPKEEIKKLCDYYIDENDHYNIDYLLK